jgi:hypothetical protein
MLIQAPKAAFILASSKGLVDPPISTREVSGLNALQSLGKRLQIFGCDFSCAAHLIH